MTEAVHVACAIRGGASLARRPDAQRRRQTIDVKRPGCRSVKGRSFRERQG
jgi:hypothetical protein